MPAKIFQASGVTGIGQLQAEIDKWLLTLNSAGKLQTDRIVSVTSSMCALPGANNAQHPHLVVTIIHS